MAVSFWVIFGAACYPVGEVLLLCLVGAVLSNRRINKFPADARKHMNYLVFLIFTPALVFVNLGPAATIRSLWEWWFLPSSVLVNSVIGACLGYLVVRVTNPPPHLGRLTVASCGVGNMSNLPLVLIPAICSNSGAMFGPNCLSRGLAYSSYGMLMGVIVMWVFVYPYLEPPEKSDNSLEPSPPPDANAHPTLIQETGPNQRAAAVGVSNREGLFEGVASIPGREATARVGLVSEANDQDVTPTDRPGERKALLAGSSAEEHAGEQTGWWLKQPQWDKMFTPPVCGVILAITVGASRPLKDTFFGANALLKLPTDVIASLAGAMTPCMMLVLGGNLADGPAASEMKAPTVFGIGCVRLILLPLLGIGVVKVGDALSLLPPDDLLFRFVLLLQFSMPTALNIGIATTMYGVDEKETSAILFWSYLACTLTLPALMMLFLYILL